MALERELDTYNKLASGLRDDEGKFALIHGQDLAGVFGTYEDALVDGYRRFGLDEFMVKKIEVQEQVQFVSRMVAQPCRS